jgi:hypothetical protein
VGDFPSFETQKLIEYKSLYAKKLKDLRIKPQKGLLRAAPAKNAVIIEF